MKILLKLVQDPFKSVCFLGSIFLLILILNQFYFFEWIFHLLIALKPLWIGILLAFFVQPFIGEKGKGKVILIYFSFFLIMALIILSLILVLMNHISEILIFLEKGFLFILEIFRKQQYLDTLEMNQITSLFLNGYEWLIPFVSNILSFLMTFFLGTIIALFLSLERNLIANEFKKYFHNYASFFQAYAVFSSVFRQYVRSTLLDMIYIMISTGIILFFFQTPYPFLLPLLLALLNLFPYVGALFGNGILLLIHFIFVKENTLLLFLILFINSQIESNIIHTWICHKTMKVHPLLLFFSLIINEFLFGVLGVILSPVFAGLLQILLTTYSEILNQKNVGGWEEISS